MNAFEASSTAQYLTFTLDQERYAVDIAKVREVLEFSTVTKVPRTPEFMRGMINLRGNIVPIVDMRIKFNLDKVAYDAFTVVIILNVANRVVGMVVDGVSDVLTLLPEQIRPSPEFGSTFDTEYLVGLGAVDQRMLILVDIEKLMTSADMALVDSSGRA